MTKEQHQEFIEFALQLKWNRDAYSRARIIEELMDKIDELVKNCSIPAVVGRSEQLVAFLKWVGDGYDFENNAEKIVKEYIDVGN